MFGGATTKLTSINRSTVKYATSLAAELNKKKKARERLEARNRIIKQNNTIDLTESRDSAEPVRPPSPVSTETQVRTVVKEESGMEVIASNRTSGPGTTLGENILVTLHVDNPAAQEQPQHECSRNMTPVASHRSTAVAAPPSGNSGYQTHRQETVSLAKRASMMSRLPLPPVGPEEETESDGVSSPYRYVYLSSV